MSQLLQRILTRQVRLAQKESRESFTSPGSPWLIDERHLERHFQVSGAGFEPACMGYEPIEKPDFSTPVCRGVGITV